MPWLLLLSLLGLLAGLVFSLEVVFGLAVVTTIVALTAMRCRSRLLLVAFWVWMAGVLLYLLRFSGDRTLIWPGLPRPAFWMLAGVWLAPILIWPLGFTARFKRWIEKP
jgi:hypothetical protein